MAYKPSVTFESFNQQASFSIIIYPIFENRTGFILMVQEKRIFAFFGKYRVVITSVSFYCQAIKVDSFK